MNFLLDMGIPQRSMMFLNQLGQDAVHLRDQGLQRLPDAEIVQKALAEIIPGPWQLFSPSGTSASLHTSCYSTHAPYRSHPKSSLNWRSGPQIWGPNARGVGGGGDFPPTKSHLRR